MAPNPYSVSELTNLIKTHLQSRFMSVVVRGEITNLKKQASGHIYFTLKDEKAQISTVLFAGTANTLAQIPKSGDLVIISGDLNVYAPRGSYQIVVKTLQLEGLGNKLLQLHKLKEELQAKGYFDPSKKKPLPASPKKIGVVTSPTGAVIQDILNVLSRRYKGFHLILYPVKVQGEGAELEIAKAIYELNRFSIVDVIIIGRGGGSLEDLWAFNERAVAEAIFTSTIPVISAVGHESDYSISDFVADVRAPTPSAAAEIVVKELASQLDYLTSAKTALQRVISHILNQNKLRLTGIKKQPLFSSPTAFVGTYYQRLDDTSSHLKKSLAFLMNSKMLKIQSLRRELDSLKPEAKILHLKEKNSKYKNHLDQAIKSSVRNYRSQLTRLSDLLSSIHPKNVLKKGYCIPFRENSTSIILSPSSLVAQERLSLQFYDGEVKAIIESVNEKQKL